MNEAVNKDAQLKARLKELLCKASELVSRSHQLTHIAGIQKLVKKCQAELKFLNKMAVKKQAKEEHLTSTNLTHLEGIVQAAESLPHVVHVLQTCSTPGHDASIVIDVVCNYGFTWVKVVARKAKALHQVWAGDGPFGEKSIGTQAAIYKEYAAVSPINFVTPQILFIFNNGVTRGIKTDLEAAGIGVFGELTPVPVPVPVPAPIPVTVSIPVPIPVPIPIPVTVTIPVPIPVPIPIPVPGPSPQHASDSRDNPLAPANVGWLPRDTAQPCDLTTSEDKGDENNPPFGDLIQSGMEKREEGIIRQSGFESEREVGLDGHGYEQSTDCPVRPDASSGVEYPDELPGRTREACDDTSQRKSCSGDVMDALAADKTTSIGDLPGRAVHGNQLMSDSTPVAGVSSLDQSESAKASSAEEDHGISGQSARLLASEDLFGGHASEKMNDERSYFSALSNFFMAPPNIQKVNLDITTLLALVSNLCHGRSHFKFLEHVLTQQAEQERKSPLLPQLKEFLRGKELYACRTALDNFETIVNTVGGPMERHRTEILLQEVRIVEDDVSAKVDALLLSLKVKERAKVIFGTGDQMRAITATSNSSFVRAAANQGINLAVYLHASRALTEQKEASAKPL